MMDWELTCLEPTVRSPATELTSKLVHAHVGSGEGTPLQTRVPRGLRGRQVRRLGRWLLEAARGPQRARVCGLEAVQDGRDGRLAGVASVVSVVSVVVFPGSGAHLRAPPGRGAGGARGGGRGCVRFRRELECSGAVVPPHQSTMHLDADIR